MWNRYLMTHSVILTYLLASIRAQPTIGIAALGRPLADLGMCVLCVFVFCVAATLTKRVCVYYRFLAGP